MRRRAGGGHTGRSPPPRLHGLPHPDGSGTTAGLDAGAGSSGLARGRGVRTHRDGNAAGHPPATTAAEEELARPEVGLAGRIALRWAACAAPRRFGGGPGRFGAVAAQPGSPVRAGCGRRPVARRLPRRDGAEKRRDPATARPALVDGRVPDVPASRSRRRDRRCSPSPPARWLAPPDKRRRRRGTRAVSTARSGASGTGPDAMPPSRDRRRPRSGP